MSESAREIILGDDFGEVVVRANGASVQIHANGRFDAVPANDSAPYELGTHLFKEAAKARTAPEVGDEMADGTIYAGISPETHQPMYARPKDESGAYTFNEAARFAKTLDAHGHHDFHVPSKGELNVLWENRNEGKLKGSFNETRSDALGWYWSSSLNGYNAGWDQRFSDGYQSSHLRGLYSSLRCVR